jgi:hypothetical protein
MNDPDFDQQDALFHFADRLSSSDKMGYSDSEVSVAGHVGSSSASESDDSWGSEVAGTAAWQPVDGRIEWTLRAPEDVSSNILQSARSAAGPSSEVAIQLHNAGKCRPCMYFKSRVGCLRGEQCNFCHVDGHLRQNEGNTARTPKAKRLRFKQMASSVFNALENNPEALAAAQTLSTKSDFINSILWRRQQDSIDASDSGTSDSSSTGVASISAWDASNAAP